MKTVDRRKFIAGGTAFVSGLAGLGSGTSATGAELSGGTKRSYQRIGTEEHFVLPEYTSAVTAYMKKNPGAEPSERWLQNGFPPVGKMLCGERIQNFDLRISEMDRDGIDHQILSLNQPGVQVLDPDTATEVAKLINDRITVIVGKYPGRFSNLATIAPQAPDLAAQELERAVKQLGMKGAMLNSHTKGKYIDDPSLWPIYEAAEALAVPIYLHPRNPSPDMVKPYQKYGLHMIWGFAAEASLNALRLLLSGVFDDFPKLQVVLGHLGEGIPFYLDRIDNRYAYIPAKYKAGARKLKRKPSEYFRENFAVTSSGQNWSPAVRFCQEVLGTDKVMFGGDYPFENQREMVKSGEAIAMSDEVRKNFFEGNARRIFRLTHERHAQGE